MPVMTERTRVRMLEAVVGSNMLEYGLHGDFAFAQGEIVGLHPKLAEAWIASERAEKAKEKAKE